MTYGKPIPGAKRDGAWVSAWVYVSVADLVWLGYNRKRKGPVNPLEGSKKGTVP